MKVLHVIAISGIGGAETLLVDLAQEQAKAGATVSCLFFYKKSRDGIARQLGLRLEESNVPVHYRQYQKIFSAATLRYLSRFIGQTKPWIIHTHLKQAETWLSLLKWRKKIDIPVVTTIHGYRDAYHNRNGMNWNNKIKFSTYYWLTKFIYRQLDLYIAISNGVASLFTDAGFLDKEKAITIYHGIRYGSQGKKPAKESIDYRLVIFGRLVPFKGHRYAIAAINLLKNKYPRLRLDIFGTGPEEQVLRRQVAFLDLEDHVSFKGFATDIREAIAVYDMALVPSVGEPFGMVFLEAFKAGLPVIAFDLPAGNEIIEHGSSGLLAEPKNEKDLAEKINQLLSDQHLRKSIVSNCQDLLATKFNLERMAKEYLTAYDKLMKLS